MPAPQRFSNDGNKGDSLFPAQVFSHRALILNIFEMIHLITEVFGLTDIGGRLCGRWGHLRMPFRQKANKATHELARQDHKKQMYSRSRRNKYCTSIVKKYKKQTM